MGKSEAENWISKGDSFLKQKQYQEAIDAYEKATSLDPANEEGWNGLLSIYESLKDWKQAIAICERVLNAAQNVHQSNAWWWWRYIEALKGVGNLAGAEKACEKALTTVNFGSENERPRHLYELGLMREELGDLPGAIEAYEAALPGLKEKELSDRLEILRRKHAQAEAQRAKETTQQAHAAALSSAGDKLKRLVKVSRSLKIAQIGEYLGLSGQVLMEKLVEWAEQYGFVLDADVMDFTGGRKDEFLAQLDKEFASWSATSKKE